MAKYNLEAVNHNTGRLAGDTIDIQNRDTGADYVFHLKSGECLVKSARRGKERWMSRETALYDAVRDCAQAYFDKLEQPQ